MTCPMCHKWEQRDPNCGHALYNGVPAPARYMTRRMVERIEIGAVPHNYLEGENSRHGDREEFVRRQAAYALGGGWRLSA